MNVLASVAILCSYTHVEHLSGPMGQASPPDWVFTVSSSGVLSQMESQSSLHTPGLAGTAGKLLNMAFTGASNLESGCVWIVLTHQTQLLWIAHFFFEDFKAPHAAAS